MARIAVLLIVIILLSGCSGSGILITGNIAGRQVLRQTGNLSEILQQKEIPAEYALVIAADGTAFFISERSFSEIKIAKEKGKFNSTSKTLPPVCNLKNIVEICIYYSEYPVIDNKTPFSSRLEDFEFFGQNSKNDHFVRKYRLKEKNIESS
ncbi:MAG: hypothetical protein K9N09_04275 [Candidatus Cloacimonetes bacterium]|nr:hypothetical protein [Candidatus Cloacimonadota bacterium]MCF7814840.1 hypothetical protein [Candidatus Cloacimonadota bacterium]MCF7867896.1 hypothetical protein [Candidatus Cloacimonadota bacterium]MCF7883715.1 hypothetical protein [Candidatus Cloacimonadota bacterium]